MAVFKRRGADERPQRPDIAKEVGSGYKSFRSFVLVLISLLNVAIIGSFGYLLLEAWGGCRWSRKTTPEISIV
jgi:nitrate reductase NapE component